MIPKWSREMRQGGPYPELFVHNPATGSFHDSSMQIVNIEQEFELARATGQDVIIGVMGRCPWRNPQSL